MANVVRGENIVLKSDGSATRLFCYLADATIGLLTVLLKGKSGTAYNVVNAEAEISVYELAKLLCGIFPERGLRVIRPDSSQVAPMWNPGIRVDTSKIRALGWQPSASPETGFRRTIQSFSAQKSE